MTVSARKPLPMSLDNFLKILIAALVGLLSFIGRQQADRLSGVEKDVSAMKLDMAEIKTHLIYLRGGVKTGENGKRANDQSGVPGGTGSSDGPPMAPLAAH